MNVLAIIRDMEVAGEKTFLRNMAPALRQRGHRCYLIAGGGKTRQMQESAFDGVYTRHLIFPWDTFWLVRLIRKLGIDVINAHSDLQFPVITKACAKTGTGLVLTLNQAYREERIGKYLPVADAIMVMNEYQRRHFASMGAASEKLFRPYWMLDWDAYQASALPVEEREFDALYCSRFSRSKGPMAVAFVQALEQLLPHLPHLRIAVLGNGTYLPQVQAAIASLNQRAGREACQLITDVLDTSRWFGKARIVAGGNYVSIEALASGAIAIGAGYDGVYGVITPDNLEEAAEMYFGDHITPNTGIKRDDPRLVAKYAEALLPALTEHGLPDQVRLNTMAKTMFRREEAISLIEQYFQQVARSPH